MISLSPKQRSIINAAFLILLFALVATFFFTNRAFLASALSSLTPVQYLIIVFTLVLQMSLRASCDRLHYQALNYRIPTRALFLLYNRQNILNYLPLKAGSIYSAFDLKGSHQVSLTHFSSVLAAQHLIMIAITIIMAGGVIGWERQLPGTGLALMAGGFGLLLFLWIPVPKFALLPDYINRGLEDIAHSLVSLKQPGRLLLSLCLRGASIIFMTWRIILLFEICGVPLTLGEGLLLSVSVLISMMVSITPASLGIREVLLALASGSLGISASTAVLVSILDRALVMLFSLIVLSVNHAIRYPGK